MRWPWQKKPEPVEPTPVSAEVAEAMIQEAIAEAREKGLGAMGYVVMSGPEALNLIERMIGEKGGLPDELREFFESGGGPDDSP